LISTLQINEGYILQFKNHFNREIERINKKTNELLETIENALNDKNGKKLGLISDFLENLFKTTTNLKKKLK
jgi:hypothetical protein